MFKLFRYSSCIRYALSARISQKCYSTQVFTPFYENFFKYSNNIAVIDRFGYHKYQDIVFTSFLIAKRIEALTPSKFETCERISFLCPNEAIYVSVLLACWISGNIAVPLSRNHPKSLMEYMITNSQSSVLIGSESSSYLIKNIATKLNVNYFTVNSVVNDPPSNHDSFRHCQFFSWDSDFRERKALLIYTSGTTGLPKGVILTHGNLFSQVSSLVKAWEITSQDAILHTLPLYHVHGIMNALLCLLSVGGTVVLRPRFDACEVWNYFINQNQTNPRVNLFFGVPTMYVILIDAFYKMSGKKQIKKCCEESIRLMTSGSAPLPEPVFHDWKKITGHYLLERFGMSEVGMVLSNPLNGPRLPGYVGKPLPGVEARIVDDSSLSEPEVFIEGSDSLVKVLVGSGGKEGELLIRGPTVFKEYWNNKKSTLEAFTDSGWFKTGDIAVYQDGSFKILGRLSADIINSAGYKISALTIESRLLSHPQIIDCSVMGIPDKKWGERIAVLLVTKNNKELNEMEIKTWCEETLPSYTVPSVIKYVDRIPRNPMGKMNKKELKKLFT